MKKKLLSLISAVLCLCMVLSACGGPANNDPSSSISESQGGDNTQDKTLTICLRFIWVFIITPCAPCSMKLS